MIGPTATPSPLIAPQMPIAFARSPRSVNTFVMIESVAGKISAAPMPMTARTAISALGVSTRTRERDSPPNTTSPASRRPCARTGRRGSRRPGRSAANDEVVGVDDPLQLAGRRAELGARGSGRAMLTMVVSTLIVNTARQSTASAAPRRRGCVMGQETKVSTRDSQLSWLMRPTLAACGSTASSAPSPRRSTSWATGGRCSSSASCRSARAATPTSARGFPASPPTCWPSGCARWRRPASSRASWPHHRSPPPSTGSDPGARTSSPSSDAARSLRRPAHG